MHALQCSVPESLKATLALCTFPRQSSHRLSGSDYLENALAAHILTLPLILELKPTSQIINTPVLLPATASQHEHLRHSLSVHTGIHNSQNPSCASHSAMEHGCISTPCHQRRDTLLPYPSKKLLSRPHLRMTWCVQEGTHKTASSAPH